MTGFQFHKKKSRIKYELTAAVVFSVDISSKLTVFSHIKWNDAELKEI